MDTQHIKLTLEKKIVPPLLPGFELAGVAGEFIPPESTLSRHGVGTLSVNDLTCNSSGNTRSQWSLLARLIPA